MNNLEIVIGIEIHIELNTKTKMFSSTPNNFHAEPNTLVGPVDLAYPGTLPVLNRGAVERAIKLAKALNMNIANNLIFDRKHYFYQDIPKSYQITQQFHPIATNGEIPIIVDGVKKMINIERFHLEEDTAKTINSENEILLNYNRAGIPLIEIVTEPVIRSAKEAASYIESIRKVAKLLNISDAKMEEGSLRADINISLRPFGNDEFGTKVEIKNINSISNVVKAIDKEVELQTKNILMGKTIQQETKRFDDNKNDNVVMRTKLDAADYRYFEDPNIPIIELKSEFIDSIEVGELPWEIEDRLTSMGIPQEYVEQLVNDPQKLQFIDKVNYEDKANLVKIFFAEVVPLANDLSKNINDLKIDHHQFEQAIEKMQFGEISRSHIKKIIPLLSNSSKTVNEIIMENNLMQISDEKKLNEMIDKIIIDNQDFINKNLDRKERVSKFILGQLMKISKGQANPVLSNELVIKKIGI